MVGHASAIVLHLQHAVLQVAGGAHLHLAAPVGVGGCRRLARIGDQVGQHPVEHGAVEGDGNALLVHVDRHRHRFFFFVARLAQQPWLLFLQEHAEVALPQIGAWQAGELGELAYQPPQALYLFDHDV